jgi:hypothetical protein
MKLLDYYACLDGPDPASGLAHVAPDIQFMIALPGRRIVGTSAGDLAAYIGGRNAVDRRHEVTHTSVDGSVEFVCATVTEAGAATGAFLASARLNADGLIDRYQVLFDTDFRLVDWPRGT